MPMQEKTDFTILYGSQTGQAEAISEELFERSFKEGFNPLRFCLGDIEKKFSLEKQKYIIIVCSTTGEGEPPDNSLKFMRRIRKKTLSSRHLQHISFTVLGLGDSNYTNFCNCSKGIVSRLNELGASSFYDPGFADDAVGLEEVVEPWIDGLFPVLRKLLKIETQNLNNLGVIDTSCVEDKEIVEVSSLSEPSIESESKMASTNDSDTNLNESTEVSKPNLRYSIPPLSTSTLKIPSSPAPFLEMNFLNDEKYEETSFDYPGAATTVKDAFITSAWQLTHDISVKKALEIELDVKDVGFDYEPGDSFGIVCENKKDEVDYLMQRLNIEDIADKLMTLQIMSNTSKKAPSVPQHIHCPSSLRNIFTNYVDFRAVPRKALLRMLVDYTDDEDEKRRLQELCSTQGSSDYNTFIRENYVGLIQLLHLFHSCTPPVLRVLELLPQLLPREYSVASYANKHIGHLKFVFNVIELPEFQSCKRYGLCTSWLDSITADMRLPPGITLEEKIKSMKLGNKVKMYFRRPTGFRFPDDPSRPLIMIGPGTGVAPFIGFLEKRDIIKKNDPSTELGTSLLFFGCRYREGDFLYRDELLRFKESGILTELYTSFSRDKNTDESHTKYVQDNIKKNKQIVLELLFEKNGAVYICGDAKHMGRDVTNMFVDLAQEYKNVSKVDAIKIVNELRQKKQFLEDVWT